MSTIQRINNKVYFQFLVKKEGKKDQPVMITKTSKGWYTLQGEKFNRVLISNFVRKQAQCDRGEVMHIRSILNRFFGYSLPYVV